MKTLFIDSTYDLKVGLVRDKKVTIICSYKDKADDLLALIDKLFEKTESSLSEVDSIAVNVGPGSFTGIRVGVSVAKGLGFSKNIKYFAFSSFDYFDTCLPCVLEGFSNFVYLKTPEGKMSCENLASLQKNAKYAVMSAEMQLKMRENGLDAEIVLPLEFDEVLKKIASNGIEMGLIRPLYLRASQAEIQREEKLKKEKK